jgi:hypothetical protein
MIKHNLQDLLEQLWRELRRADDVDVEAKQDLEALHRDVDQLGKQERSDVDSLRDRARELETRFAAEHPTFERIARELADTLAKMGV